MEEDFFDNELIHRFEEMIENNAEYYFDTSDIEDIAITYLEWGEIHYAQLAIEHGLKIHPNSTAIKIKKLEVLLELDQNKEAKILIDEIEDIAQNHLDFLICCAKYYANVEDYQLSLYFCEKALEKGQEKNFLYNFIADIYFNCQNFQKAIEFYQKALVEDPEDQYAMDCLINTYQKINAEQDALEFLSDFLNQDPFSEMAWKNFAILQFNQENFPKALEAFDNLLAISEGKNSDSFYLYNKAVCFESLEQWENAIETYTELLDYQDQEKDILYYKIGRCYKKNSCFSKAIFYFQKAIDENPFSDESMSQLAEIYHKVKKLDEAIDFIKEAININSENVNHHKDLAFYYIEAENLEQSLIPLKKITQLETYQFKNWYAYSEVLILLENYTEAILIIENALKLFPKAEFYYQLSHCYFCLEEKERSKDFFKIALDLDKESLLLESLKKYPHLSVFIEN